MSEIFSKEIIEFLHKKNSVIHNQTKFFRKLGLDEGEIADLGLYKYAIEKLTPYDFNVEDCKTELGRFTALVSLKIAHWLTDGDPTTADITGGTHPIEQNHVTQDIKIDQSELVGQIWNLREVEKFLIKEYDPAKKDSSTFNYTVNYLGWSCIQLLMGPAIKMAYVDGEYRFWEKDLILKSFVNDWGFNLDFIESCMSATESKIKSFQYSEYKKSIQKILDDFSSNLSETKIQQKGEALNFDHFAEEIIAFLEKVQKADGKIHEKEVEELEQFKKAMLA